MAAFGEKIQGGKNFRFGSLLKEKYGYK